jgi:plastocyanin
MKRVFVCVALVLFVAAGCGKSSSNNQSKALPPQPPVNLEGRAQVEVDAQFNLFTPPDIIISPGTTVTWRNKDAVAHNVKNANFFDKSPTTFGAETASFGPGASYSYKFTTPGKYFYQCTIHSLMSGTIQVVGAASTPSTTSTSTTTSK